MAVQIVRANYLLRRIKKEQTMWGTSQGDRTLEWHEAALVRKSVGYLRDMITASVDLEEPYLTEVNVFNQLQPTQQLAVLHEVAFALLDKEVAIPELTAVREATVYAIFLELNSLVELEIELAQASLGKTAGHRGAAAMQHVSPESLASDFQTREMVAAACHQINSRSSTWGREEFSTAEHAAPDVDSEDLSNWASAIEFMANQILWDRDFELESMFADHDPGKVADIKAYLGINHDYFSTPAPDACSSEFQRLDRELVALTQNDESSLGL
ncbi:MAG: hypothetical protein ACI87E_003293 [Mariniblastus sp.]|jgi:hypothetical protein